MPARWDSELDSDRTCNNIELFGLKLISPSVRVILCALEKVPWHREVAGFSVKNAAVPEFRVQYCAASDHGRLRRARVGEEVAR